MWHSCMNLKYLAVTHCVHLETRRFFESKFLSEKKPCPPPPPPPPPCIHPHRNKFSFRFFTYKRQTANVGESRDYVLRSRLKFSTHVFDGKKPRDYFWNLTVRFSIIILCFSAISNLRSLTLFVFEIHWQIR